MKSNVCNGRAKRLVQLQNLGIWGQFFMPNVLDYPHLPLKCKLFIICTWTKMTCKYLLDLRKDIIIMVGNSAKISPIYFCGEISSYMKILPILPHLDPTLSRSLQINDPRDRMQFVVCKSLSPHLPFMSFWNYSTYCLSYFLFALKMNTPVKSRRFASDFQAPPYYNMGPTCLTSKYRNDSVLP